MWGIGFKKADVIALSIGIARDSVIRVNACVRYVVKEASTEGHCYLPQEELIRRVTEYVACDESKIHEAITDGLKSEKIVYVDSDASNAPLIYDAAMYRCEMEIARKLLALAATPLHEEITSNLSASDIAVLDDDQQRALALALKSKILVITGGAGNGKTFTTKTIIEALGARKNLFGRAYGQGREANVGDDRASGVDDSPAAAIQSRPGGIYERRRRSFGMRHDFDR